MLVDGLAIGGYRSFGRDVQFIGPLEKVNLFIGPNNSGKSNILRVVMHHLAGCMAVSSAEGFSQIDRPKLGGHIPLVLGLGRRVSAYSNLVPETDTQNSGTLSKLLKILERRQISDVAWFINQAPSVGEPLHRVDPDGITEHSGLTEPQVWERLRMRLTSKGAGGNIRENVAAVISILQPSQSDFPHAYFVPAIRKITGDGRQANAELSGLGLVHRLAELQDPTHEARQDRTKFEAINEFVKGVTQNQSAVLHVPHSRTELEVHMDGKPLPLSSLGTGIHEVIILAVAATVVEKSILCIEEPEIHLHPTLQRQLLAFFADRTDNQFFITTHSAALIDTPHAAVFRVQLDEQHCTKVGRAVKPSEKRAICDELGYRASDLLQANCIIWVEGPSDRIYLNHWIRACDSELVEGVHYSTMFYGGRLLNHLSEKDPEVEEFISLRVLNRNLVVLMDSDVNSKHEGINDTKKRIETEFSGDKGGFAWVTAGKEIENYVPPELLTECVEAVRPGLGRRVGRGKYKTALPFVDQGNRRCVDKIKVANEVAQRPPDLSRFDLAERIEQLVSFIRRANHGSRAP
jgi:hypothetical protein